MRRPSLFARRRRAAILSVLAEHGQLSAYEITLRTGRWSSVYVDLGALEEAGLVASEVQEALNGSRIQYWRLAERQAGR
jgi:DNA-binding transcriptional ArsR family regulator